MAHKRFDEQMEALDALKGQELDEAGVALVKEVAGEPQQLSGNGTA